MCDKKDCKCGKNGCKCGKKGCNSKAVADLFASKCRKVDQGGELFRINACIMHYAIRGNHEKAYDIWAHNAPKVAKLTSGLVKAIEEIKTKYPSKTDFLMAMVSANYPFYDYLAQANVCLLDSETRVSKSTYAYMKKIAKSNGTIFSVTPVKGFGVYVTKEGFDTVDFANTKFFSDKNGSVSGMVVDTCGIKEKVVVKNNEDTFDIDKAAMWLLLKGTYGGAACDIVRLIKEGLEADMNKSKAEPSTKDTDVKSEEFALADDETDSSETREDAFFNHEVREEGFFEEGETDEGEN